MSDLGKSEMARWIAEVRALFAWLPAITITDDGVTPNTAVTSVLSDHTLRIALWPGMVPGRAVGWHELGHCVQRTLQLRVDDMLALVTEAYAVRGFPPTVTVATLPAAFECMAGMLPEAFIGEWAGGLGIPHPLYGWDSGVPGGPSHPQVTAYFQSPASQKVRSWFLSLATWMPSALASGPVTPPTPPVPARTMAHDIEWLGPVPQANFYGGRLGNPVVEIVDHWTDASFDSAVAHFLNPALPKPVSAHYVISQSGRIVQLVRDEDTAYHAGIFAVNLRAIGIEHEASPTQLPSGALYAASAWLHQKLSLDHGIRLIVGDTVKPHRAIVTTECPGTLDLERIVNEAGGEDMFTDDDRKMLKRVYDHLEAYEPLVWTKRLQQWAARAIHSIYASADLTGPDVETGEPFK